MKKDYKIAVAGTGYVGLSIATLLSQHHQVTAVDIIPEKVDKFIPHSCCNMNNYLPLTTSNSPEKCSYHVHLSSAINFSRKIDFGFFNTFNLHL